MDLVTNCTEYALVHVVNPGHKHLRYIEVARDFNIDIIQLKLRNLRNMNKHKNVIIVPYNPYTQTLDEVLKEQVK